MSDDKSRTAEVNGALWGARARDWAEVQEGTAAAAFAAVLDACDVGQNMRLLDMGCGAGMAAQIAAARGAEVAGVDAAEPLLAIARTRVPAGDFRIADLEAVPFESGSFDVVMGVNAFQYAGTPRAALAEARRVARAGGQVSITVWGEPAGMEMAAVITALGKLLPPPPPGTAGPFALSDAAALRALVASAGLTVERLIDTDAVVTYPDLATALRGLNSSGVAARAMGIAGEAAVTEAHEAALAPFSQADGSYRIGARFRTLLSRP